MESLEPPNFAASPEDLVEPALDGLDEVALEPAAPPEPAAVSTGYAPETAGRLKAFAAIFAIVLVLAFFVVHYVKGRGAAQLERASTALAEQAPTVEVVKVDYAPPTQVLSLPGETQGWFRSTIFARVNGYLAKWSVDIGDRVKKDQVLATIDTPDLDAQLAGAEAHLKAAEADVQVKEADAQFARTTFERWQTSPRGVVSEQDRQDKRARYAVAVAQLNAARARVNLDRADVERLTDLTRFKQVTAPFDGTVTERRVDIGDLVTAGSTASTTPLFSISQDDNIRVFAEVPQRASVDLAVGNPAQITASEYPNRVFEGKITRTSHSIDPHARTLRVEVDLPNQDLALVPGMYVQAQFHLRPTKFVHVPASAILFRASGPQVALIDGNERVKFQDIVIARDNGKFVEIASGLSAGDRVAVNISNQIGNGDKVAVAEDGKAAPVATR